MVFFIYLFLLLEDFFLGECWDKGILSFSSGYFFSELNLKKKKKRGKGKDGIEIFRSFKKGSEKRIERKEG